MPYSDVQQMLMLAYAVDTYLTDLSGNGETDALALRKVLTSSVLPDINKNAGTNWSLAWGPFIKTEPYSFRWDGHILPQLKYRIVNAMIVLRDGNRHAVAVAGTDFRSAYDWLFEDFSVLEMRPWKDLYPKTKAPHTAKVSLAMHKGFGILEPATPPKGLPGQGTTLTQYLNAIQGPADLFVTGHSLGGALAPIMGLWIADQQKSHGLWPSITTNVFSYAGPTPGEVNFQSYYDKLLGHTTARVWNAFDIVPNAWNHDLLKSIQAQYNLPANKAFAPSRIENGLIDAAALVGKAKGYVHVLPDSPALPNGAFNPSETSFISQLFDQHIDQYPVLLKVDMPPPPPWPPVSVPQEPQAQLAG